MRNQTLKLCLTRSMAIVLLTFVWGLISIPKQGELSAKSIRASLEQDSYTLVGAVKSSLSALRYRLLDVLKAEGNDIPTRTFHNSPIVSASLLEWDQNQWKVAWHSTKVKDQFQLPQLRAWMANWPLSKMGTDETHMAKVGDWQGQAYYAILVPVRKPNNVPLMGIGIFPVAQLGLALSAERARETRVFDDQGFAVALARAAYIGASVKRENLVNEILESGDVLVRSEWSQKGEPFYGVASRVPGSNLFVSVESSLNPPVPYRLSSWLYLLLTAMGAILINLLVARAERQPLLLELDQQARAIEQLKRHIQDSPTTVAQQELPLGPMPDPQLETLDFVEPSTLPAPELLKSPTLEKVLKSALRSLEGRIQELGVKVAERGSLRAIPASGDALQLQTALEEVLKNGLESMQFSQSKWLTITGEEKDGQVILTIEDTGSGISPENLPKVFDPFFSTKDAEGVSRGLGLNVARRVIEEMKGSMRVDSHQGLSSSGTTVTMQWPLEHVEVALPVPAPEPAAEPTALDEIPIETVSTEPPPSPVVAISDLDLLADGYEAEDIVFKPMGPLTTELPKASIRKPRVRSLD
ncbi:MAG: sensor histidine kinase [Bdellovibrionales bacterium]